jgi:hypothetical protein
MAKRPLAHYANYFEVGHNRYEFFIDFGQFHPEIAEVSMHTRIAMGPIYAKLFADVLRGAVQTYEAENGRIPAVADPPAPASTAPQAAANVSRALRRK